MTFAQLKAETLRELEEIADSPVYFSEEDIEELINDGYMEMADASEFVEVYRTITLLNSRPYYDVRTIFNGQTVLTLGRSFNITTNRPLEPIAWQDLDDRYRRWEQVRPSMPSDIIRRGLFWVSYWPINGSASGTVRQHATTLPTPLDADTDVPLFPVTYHRGLVDYALSEALPQLGEVSKGMAAWNRYLEFETGLIGYVGGRGQRTMKHSMGTDRQST